MKVKMSGVFVLLVASAAILHLNCASTIGFAIGSAKDSSKPDSLYLPGWKAEAVKWGTRVNLVLNDGSQVSGIYRGLRRVADQEYADRYSRFLKHGQDAHFLPALGDTITITMNSGARLEREFLGFDHQRLAGIFEAKTMAILEVPSLAILTRQVEGDTAGVVFAKNLIEIAYRFGDATEGTVLRRLAAENRIPLLSAVMLERSARTVQAPSMYVQ